MDMEKRHQRQELFKKCVKQLVEASVRLGGGRIIQRRCVRVDLVKGCVLHDGTSHEKGKA